MWGKLFCLSFLLFGNAVFANNIQLTNDHWLFDINPLNLEVIATNKQNKSSIKIADGIKGTEVTQLQSNHYHASWYFPTSDLHIQVETDKKGLVFHFSTQKEQTLHWPVAGAVSEARALVIPAGEGLYIPNKSSFWLNEFKKHSKVALILPFLGVQYPEQYVSYLTPHNERMEYKIN